MADVKWIKLSTSMFDDEKIRLIEQMPDADTILIIWMKLLTQAGKTNSSGYIFLSENIPYTDEMLATIFNRPLSTVRLALKTFEELGMIGIDESSFISITNWERHQNIEGLERIRIQNRERKRRQREREKKVLPDKIVTSRDSHATEEELEEDIDIDKEQIPYAEIIKYLNEKAGKRFKHTANKTKELIRARWNEGNRLEDFKQVIDVCCQKWSGQVFSNGQNGDEYLRPSTLFNGKFDERLNWTIKNKETHNKKSPEQLQHEKELREMQERIKANELS